MRHGPGLSRLDEDPDQRLARWGWLAWTAFTLLLVVLWWRAGAFDRESALPWALGAPALGLWLLWPLWRGVQAGWRWLRERSHGQWHGSYFEFDGRQIRVLFDADDIWIEANDVFDALGLAGRARDPVRVRQVSGRDGLVIVPQTRLLAFTERGLSVWMERRTDRAAVDFGRWFESQVVLPHRRKRALVKAAAAREQAQSGPAR